MRIGHITLANRLFVAPMAGVTDRPFRKICKRLGAGYAVSRPIRPCASTGARPAVAVSVYAHPSVGTVESWRR